MDRSVTLARARQYVRFEGVDLGRGRGAGQADPRASDDAWVVHGGVRQVEYCVVTVGQLMEAKPQDWSSASNGWTALLNLTRETSDDIRNRGQGPISENWQDAVGAQAAGKLGDLANEFDIASYTFSSVSMILDGLAEAIELAQRTLQDAVGQAAGLGLKINDDGTVQVTESGLPGAAGDAQAPAVQALVNEALTAATKADQEAAAEFRKLAQQVSNTDPSNALETVQQEASNDELAMFADAIPSNASPSEVAAWWNSLTPQQQTQLENAVPTSLYNLNGIPQGVKNQLAGPGQFNRMKFVQFAQDNWNKDTGDLGWWFLQKDSCTSFTSTAMANAGVPQSDAWHTGTFQGIFGELDAATASPTWGAAQNFHDFLTSHGGQEIPASQAKPGDVVFFESEGGPAGPPGHVHHTAIITAVLPNGDIRYTQHSNDALNYSADGRSQQIADVGGATRLVVVQPNVNGY